MRVSACSVIVVEGFRVESMLKALRVVEGRADLCAMTVRTNGGYKYEGRI
jgi:hypothetical protein